MAQTLNSTPTSVLGLLIELGERLDVPMPAARAMYAYAPFLDAHRATRVRREWRWAYREHQ